MNSYERVVAALNHQEPDRVPVYPLFAGVTRKLIGASYEQWSTDAETCANAYLEAVRQFPDMDCVVTLIDLSVECTAWGQKVVYSELDAGHPDMHDLVIKDIDEYEDIEYVDYRTCERMMMHLDVCKRLVAELKGEKPVVAFVFGPMGTLSMLRGQQDMYLDVYDDPDLVKDAIHNVALTLKDYAEALCDIGVDAIMWDTLFASGSIMSKSMWDEFEGDDIQMLAEAVEAKGVMNMIHNCGNAIYFDAQIKRIKPAAISFLFPADDCADFVATKEKYGDQTTLIGCVTPANAAFGTDEEWERQCRAMIDDMAAGGGFMLAPGCEYPSGAPFDRGQKMIDIAKTYGVYA